MKEETLATMLGLVAGSVYFWIGEGKESKDSNATYLSPITTDILAWAGGAYLVHKGYQHKDPTLNFIGACVASIHVSQFAAHKVITNRIQKNGS